LRDAFAVEGLQQVIDGIDFKGFDGVLVESGGEDNFGKRVLAVEKLLDYAETIETGHLNVEKDEIGIVLPDEADGLNAILALSDDVHVARAFEKEGEFVAGQLLVVHNYGGKRHERSIGVGWERVNGRARVNAATIFVRRNSFGDKETLRSASPSKLPP